MKFVRGDKVVLTGARVPELGPDPAIETGAIGVVVDVRDSIPLQYQVEWGPGFLWWHPVDDLGSLCVPDPAVGVEITHTFTVTAQHLTLDHLRELVRVSSAATGDTRVDVKVYASGPALSVEVKP